MDNMDIRKFMDQSKGLVVEYYNRYIGSKHDKIGVKDVYVTDLEMDEQDNAFISMCVVDYDYVIFNIKYNMKTKEITQWLDDPFVNEKMEDKIL